MQIQIMDETGHTNLVFSPEEKDKAKQTLETFLNAGKLCYNPGENGQPGTAIRKFEDAKDLVIVSPQLIGG